MRALLLRCPYCMGGFGPSDAITRCSRCSAVHHQSCWVENGHCTVFACNGSQLPAIRFKHWMDYAPALLLLLLAIYPVPFIPLQFLWFPAFVCCAYSTIQLFSRIVRGNTLDFRRSALCLSLNIAAVVSVMIQVLKSAFILSLNMASVMSMILQAFK